MNQLKITMIKKCYYCYQNKTNCQLVNDNKKTLAYLMGEDAYLCLDCSYFLRVGKIMNERMSLKI